MPQAIRRPRDPHRPPRRLRRSPHPLTSIGASIRGRRLLVTHVVDQGRPVAHVVKELGCSRATGYKWLRRWRT
ncbi:helix-turn-helix domain-containing protein [Micromonospora sp. R77]|uniref:helix-turn-helix domain-containing protein n=1 Tax=Micromonospora sp. R77 TaxID=2925836 RepID=UPI0035AEE43B